MTVWRWINRDVVFAAHDLQLAQHGGLDGVMETNLIDSALARAQQLDAYGDRPTDVFDLAAAYCYCIVKNYGFSDGNKRTGWILARLFLADNGINIQYTAQDAIDMVLGVAAGTVTEKELTQWMRCREK